MIQQLLFVHTQSGLETIFSDDLKLIESTGKMALLTPEIDLFKFTGKELGLKLVVKSDKILEPFPGMMICTKKVVIVEEKVEEIIEKTDESEVNNFEQFEIVKSEEIKAAEDAETEKTEKVGNQEAIDKFIEIVRVAH